MDSFFLFPLHLAGAFCTKRRMVAPNKKWVVEAIRSIALKVFGAAFYKKLRRETSKQKKRSPGKR